MKMSEHIVAYIDGANLHEGVKTLGWSLDYGRFRIWLREKYGVERAYIFIGLVPKYKEIYNGLVEAGFSLIFKETILDGQGKVKGNCDADLVLKTVVDFYERKSSQVVIVSSDGDYSSLVTFLKEKSALRVLLSPSNKCSVLLYRTGAPITFLDQVKSYLAKKKKPPLQTEP